MALALVLVVGPLLVLAALLVLAQVKEQPQVLELIPPFEYLPLMFLLAVRVLWYRELGSRLPLLSEKVQQLQSENPLPKDLEKDLALARQELKFQIQQLLSRLQLQLRSVTERSLFRGWGLQQG
jgi:hypothetical protein